MTSVEPGIIDANILVYALDADHPHHAASRILLDAGRTRSATLYVTSQVVCEFYSIVTNPKRVPKPGSPADAIRAIKGLLAFLVVLPTPPDTVPTLLGLSQRYPVTGGDVFDLQLIAAMKANSIQRIYTFNARDFQPFSELIVIVPGR